MTTTHAQLVDKLNRLSVTRHHDAYADIDWDAAAHHIDAGDPRWELGDEHPLGGSPWYRALPPERRRLVGLQVVTSAMRLGLEFEGVLKRGLLEVALALPVESPDQRYAYHELIEEAQHSLMFSEFIRRARAAAGPASLPAPGLPRHLRPLRDLVVATARLFPELFFVFVLGGEDPIDLVQREALSSGRAVHPLLRRIMQIHVAEEARHVAFARSYLRERVPALSPARKQVLALLAPAILAVMARLMLGGGRLARAHGVSTPRRRVAESVVHVRELLADLGLVRPRLWRHLGVS